jgi:hypothetical protein
MPTENVQRKLTAVLSGDAQSYSRLMGEDEVLDDPPGIGLRLSLPAAV